jgi:hypothetical protein
MSVNAVADIAKAVAAAASRRALGRARVAAIVRDGESQGRLSGDSQSEDEGRELKHSFHCASLRCCDGTSILLQESPLPPQIECLSTRFHRGAFYIRVAPIPPQAPRSRGHPAAGPEDRAEPYQEVASPAFPRRPEKDPQGTRPDLHPLRAGLSRGRRVVEDGQSQRCLPKRVLTAAFALRGITPQYLGRPFLPPPATATVVDSTYSYSDELTPTSDAVYN